MSSTAVVQLPKNNRPLLNNGVYHVYLQSAPDTVVLAVAAALVLTNNLTLSTNLVATTATNTFTIAAPPCDGFVKTVRQVNSGAGTITAVSGVNIYSNASLLTNVAIPAKSSVTLIGVGSDWHVVETSTPNTTPALAGSLNPVYLTAKPEIVAASGAAAVTCNWTLSSTASTSALTLVAPPVDGFMKIIYQNGTGSSTVAGSGCTITNGVTLLTTVNLATTAGVQLIGSGGNWFVVGVVPTGTVIPTYT